MIVQVPPRHRPANPGQALKRFPGPHSVNNSTPQRGAAYGGPGPRNLGKMEFKSS